MSQIREISRSITEDLFAKGKLDLVEEYFAEDYVGHNPPEGFGSGREGLRAFVQTIHERLSDIEAEATHVLVDGDRSAVRWTVRAVHSGEFFGIPPTNETVHVDGISIYQFEGGRVAEEWTRSNDLEMLQQMGALPETA